MGSIWVAIAIFLCLLSASLVMMHLYPKLAARHRDEDTNTVVRLVANIFVVMTSLVFGLMINSAKNTFEAIDANVHTYATSLIILDRSLSTYGQAANDSRMRLQTYVEEAIANPYRGDQALLHQKSTAAKYLDAVGGALNLITPVDRFHESMMVDIRQQYHGIIEQRWKIVEQSEGSIPGPLIGMLVAWMTLIFASLGYRAPQNPMVIAMFTASAFLIAASVYLVLDMNVPFHGPIQVSDAPLRRPLAEMQL
ncbi:bestrophin-like domain [Pseudomonas rustica]